MFVDQLKSVSMLLLALLGLIAGCQTAGAPLAQAVSSTQQPLHVRIPSPDVWGGEVRCSAMGCKMVVVEHENNAVVVHSFSGRQAKEEARVSVAYHPDSARWIGDGLIVAAVEASYGIVIFRLEDNKLIQEQIISVGFAPRDVVLVSQSDDQIRLVATPYSGSEVKWIDLPKDRTKPAKVTAQTWCASPWHPRLVPVGGGDAPGPGLIVGCLDARKVVYVPLQGGAVTEVARFNDVPRMVMPSPSGRWWYVALELGGKNARIDSHTGDIQWLPAPSWGAVSIAPVADDLVVWGDDRRVFFQRYAPNGEVIETRELPATGFPTELQLLDDDMDGHLDLNIYNSAGTHVDVQFGPLWERAIPTGTDSSNQQKLK